MKNIISTLLVTLLVNAGFAQGLVEKYMEDCSCFEITNTYEDGQISAKLYKNANRQMHGLETVYYQSGAIQYQRNWKNDKLDGTGQHYFRDGKLYYEEIYTNGKKSGEWKFYDNEGDLAQTVTYTGLNSDGKYSYYHAGVKYLEQVVSNGSMSEESVLNQEIYDTLKAEAESNKRLKEEVN